MHSPEMQNRFYFLIQLIRMKEVQSLAIGYARKNPIDWDAISSSLENQLMCSDDNSHSLRYLKSHLNNSYNQISDEFS